MFHLYTFERTKMLLILNQKNLIGVILRNGLNCLKNMYLILITINYVHQGSFRRDSI
jgi:hypothetical protein